MDLYTADEAGVILGVTGGQVRRSCRFGQMEFTRVGLRKILISRQQLNEFIRTHRHNQMSSKIISFYLRNTNVSIKRVSDTLDLDYDYCDEVLKNYLCSDTGVYVTDSPSQENVFFIFTMGVEIEINVRNNRVLQSFDSKPINNKLLDMGFKLS